MTTTSPQLATMPAFVARCLEEIALEGRCGLPVSELFAMVDDAHDLVYRRYAWHVLRAMGDQIRFHSMTRVDEKPQRGLNKSNNSNGSSIVDAPPRQQEGNRSSGGDDGGGGGDGAVVVKREKRRRKWSTTLMDIDEGEQKPTGIVDSGTSTYLMGSPLGRSQRRGRRNAIEDSPRRLETTHEDEPLIRPRRRRRRTGLHSECSTEDAENEAATSQKSGTSPRKGTEEGAQEPKHEQEVAQEDTETTDSSAVVATARALPTPTMVASPSPPTVAQARSRGDDSSNSSIKNSKSSGGGKALAAQRRRGWLLRSPRGFVLGQEVVVKNFSYEDAVAETEAGVLGIVACQELQLKYLGVMDPCALDVTSPQFDLLEVIGRAREQGANAAELAGTLLFGDSRKLHYLLDMLIASNFVEKNIVTADHRRFNIIHLSRFAEYFHPSMVSPSATLERTTFSKDQLPQLIVQILQARGERTCVFADIGRELGYNKRHQEKLRKHFLHQMHLDATFPLELFMARCNTRTDSKGRKLWCIRIRSRAMRSSGQLGSGSESESDHEIDESRNMGPVIERGIMEQMYALIEDRGMAGTTIPELRDALGVPTFKLPYKLAQGLITSYNLSVEQVVLGKSTMYRMFVPDETIKLEAETTHSGGTEIEQDGQDSTSSSVPNVNKELVMGDHALALLETAHQPATMKEATRGLIVGSTAERRRTYILDRVKREKIVSIHHLRSGLVEMESPCGMPISDVGGVDIRSIRRILKELETQQVLVMMDITLPPKQVLQKSQRIVKCAAVQEAQRDRTAIRGFIKTYLEDQQRKLEESMHQENDAFIVVSTRNQAKMTSRNPANSSDTNDNGKAGTNTNDISNKEIVKYSAASYKLARVHLVKLHKQCRRLGMYFGVMYRCRALHLLMWERVPLLQDLRASSTPKERQVPVSSSSQPSTLTISLPTGSSAKKRESRREMVFALKEILDLMTVREYVQLVGTSELLSENEENKIRMTVARGDSWEALSPEVQRKVRACEADRFSRVLRVLIELGLLHVADASSHDLLRVLTPTDDFDQVISQVAFATMTGGLFQLNSRIRIAIKRGNTVLKVLPSTQSYVYAAGFSGKSRSEHFSGRIPLEYDIRVSDDAKEYWKSLKFLSLEGARLGSGNKVASLSVNVNLDSELVRPLPLRDHNIYSVKVWVPKATAIYSATLERAKAAAAAVDSSTRVLKRKRYAPAIKSTTANNTVDGTERAEKLPRLEYDGVFSSGLKGHDSTPDRTRISARWRESGLGGENKSVIWASKWSSDDDIALVNLYIERLSCQWFIDVPLALQRHGERVAFRTTSLSRTRMSWKSLAEKMGRRRKDCMLRVRELLGNPAVRARVEKTKKTITSVKNPGGQFSEECAVIKQPHLTALLSRALQIILHERASYYSVLADMLISHWKEHDVKLVWRYLWLAGVITRTTKANEGKNQKQRGFCIHSQVHEMTSLGIPHYSIDFFCDAAEYASFVQQNQKEVEMLGDLDSSSDNSKSQNLDSDGLVDRGMFEREVEANARPSQVAIDLASLVENTAIFIPEYAPPPSPQMTSPATRDDHTSPDVSTPLSSTETVSLEDNKRSLAIKGFAGHLSKQSGGAIPDEFLKEYWSVKAVYPVQNESPRRHAQQVSLSSANYTSTANQAFSTALPFLDTRVKASCRSSCVDRVSSWLQNAIIASGVNGLSLRTIIARYEQEGVQNNLCSVHRRQQTRAHGARSSFAACTHATVEEALNTQLQDQDVVEVNGYDCVRYVSAKHAAMWTVNPYRIASDSSKGKVHFVFEQDRPIVSRPWLHLDGSVNAKVALTLKRRVVNIIMCLPGIQDHAIHHKMHNVVSLQDTRSLLDELITDEIVYARVGRHSRADPPRSVFDLASGGIAFSSPRNSPLYSLSVLPPGELRHVDSDVDRLHYFPTVNCVELLGAAACDVDLGRRE